MNAVEFSKHVWVVLIGVGEFKYKQLEILSSPAIDAPKLRTAFTDPFGLSVPLGQVWCLINDEAAKKDIVSALKTAVNSVGPQDILVIYFTGHGMRDESNFYLCPYDADTSDLPQTAVKSTDLETILNQSSSRGVLLILDCCRSASFSQLAPNFFNILLDKDFKILLSASRADEPSWEVGQGQGTIFSSVLCNVLSGKDRISSSPGLVYFSELIKHLQEQVREELEVNHPAVPIQEPIFTGTYSKDPLLFVHHRLTLSQVSVRTLRYSTTFIRKKIRQVVLSVAVVLFSGIGVIYSVLENSQYIALENGALALYNGLPNFNFLSFPKKVWVFEFKEDDIGENSQLSKNKVIKAALSQDVVSLLLNELNPDAQAKLLHWQHKDMEANRIITSFLSDTVNSSQQDQLKSLEALNTIEGKIDSTFLVFYSHSFNLNVRIEALKALFRIDPSRAKEIAMKDPSLWATGIMQQEALHSQLVRKMDTCRPEINEYFSFLLSEAINYTHRLVWENSLENKCELSVEDIVNSHLRITTDDLEEDLANYTSLQRSDKQKLICERLIKSLKMDVNKEVKKVILKTLSKTSGPVDSVIYWQMLKETDSDLRNCALRIILSKKLYNREQSRKIIKTFGSDVNSLCLLVKYGLVNWKKLIPAFAIDDLSIKENMLDALQSVADKNRKEIGEYLSTLLQDPKQYYRIRQHVLTILDKMDYPPPNMKSYLYDDYHSVQQPVLNFYARHKYDEAVSLMLARLNDNYFDQVINFFSRNKMPDSVYKVVKKKYVYEIPNETIITLIAMHGSAKDYMDLINSLNPKIRYQAASYFICNPNRKAIIDALKVPTTPPQGAIPFLLKQYQLFIWLEQEIARTPDGYRAWRGSQLLRNYTEDLSDGLKLQMEQWIGSEINE